MEAREEKYIFLSTHPVLQDKSEKNNILYFHTNTKLKRQSSANDLCGTVNIGALGAEACLRLPYK